MQHILQQVPGVHQGTSRPKFPVLPRADQTVLSSPWFVLKVSRKVGVCSEPTQHSQQSLAHSRLFRKCSLTEDGKNHLESIGA